MDHLTILDGGQSLFIGREVILSLPKFWSGIS